MKVIEFKKLAFTVAKDSGSLLQKLLESHDIKDNDEIVEFVYLIIDNDGDFFTDTKMPSSWGKRACSSAMESLYTLLNDDSIKNALLEDMEESDFDKLQSVLKTKKKEYMNIYKKEQRKKQKDVTGAKVSTDVVPAETLVDLDDDDDDDDDDSNDVGDNVLDAFAKAKLNRISCETNDGMISKDCVLAKSKKIVDLLKKYMTHEPDEFKVLFLEVIQDELENICN
jgi:hypothetical protein